MSSIASTALDIPEETGPTAHAAPIPPLVSRIWASVDGLVRSFALRSPAQFWAARIATVVTLDALAILAALRLTRALLPGTRTLQMLNDLWFATAFTAVTLATLFLIGAYRRSWRFLSLGDALYLTIALLTSSSVIWLMTATFVIPQRVYRIELLTFLVVHVLLMVVAMLTTRICRRQFRQYLSSVRSNRSMQRKRRVLLLGDVAWVRVMIELVRTDVQTELEIAGVLTFDGRERKLKIAGIPVLGSPEMLPEIVRRLDSAGRRPVSLVVQENHTLLDRQKSLRIAALADAEALTVSRFRSPWIRAAGIGDRIDIEKMPLAELLGRPEIVIEHGYVERLIAGKRVLVTGAGGTIGSELVRQLATYSPAEIILLDHAEYNLYAIELEARERFPGVTFHPELCSVRQSPALRQVFERRRPEIVFHAAALKHVPMVEANPCAGVHTNVIGTRNVADLVCEFESMAMIQVSTDKAVNPVGLMGATKRLGELYCQALDLIGGCDPDSPRFLTVRFGNVLGSSGSLIPLFHRQIAAGKPVTVTHPDIERFFMTIEEAVLLILQSSAQALESDADRGMIFVLDMGQPVKIVEIAKRVIRAAGLRPGTDVPIRFIGLRPGEKLYEELFDTSESKIESSIPGIFEAMPSPIPLELLVEGFHQLERLITKGDAIELSRLTHEMVVASASSRWAEILRRLAVESGDKTMINPPTPTLLSRASQSPAIPLSRAVG